MTDNADADKDMDDGAEEDLPVSVKKDTMSPMFRLARKASTALLLLADFRPAHIPTARMRM